MAKTLDISLFKAWTSDNYRYDSHQTDHILQSNSVIPCDIHGTSTKKHQQCPHNIVRAEKSRGRDEGWTMDSLRSHRQYFYASNKFNIWNLRSKRPLPPLPVMIWISSDSNCICSSRNLHVSQWVTIMQVQFYRSGFLSKSIKIKSAGNSFSKQD